MKKLVIAAIAAVLLLTSGCGSKGAKQEAGGKDKPKEPVTLELFIDNPAMSDERL